MKTLPEGLSAQIADGVMRHVRCWRLTRADGVSVGATEHDRALERDGVRYEPGAALEMARFIARPGLAPDPAEVAGALSLEAIAEADLDAGLWDRARVEVWLYDWADAQAAGLLLWSGRLSAVSRRGAAFSAELISLKGDLEAPLGRVIARACDAALGDARCGVDLSRAEFAGAVCDKALSTCITRFGNAQNFRGFPDLIGNDALVSGPEGARDGSSRRTGVGGGA
jgi:hypothetical protein